MTVDPPAALPVAAASKIADKVLSVDPESSYKKLG
jgi:hypothetical protein